MSQTQIKISDLLLEVGKQDTLDIHNMNIPSLPQLSKEGIQANLHLQSIDLSTIVATLRDIQCVIHEHSDLSGEAYDRPVTVQEYIARFVQARSDLQEDGDDPIFPIVGDFIDIAEMLYQAIKLQEPIIKHTPAEQAAIDAEESLDDEDDDLTDSGGQVTFSFVKK